MDLRKDKGLNLEELAQLTQISRSSLASYDSKDNKKISHDLSDEMVALLKSGRINNRLLCELATHKNFIKFFSDIEVYVDEIASMQIQNLNSLVNTVRHEIIERYRPREDDPHLRILQAAHIEDDEYSSHMIQDDISAIVRNIRAAHKSDSESAPPTTIAEELKQDLEDVTNFKGIPLEKQAALYCKRLGINYNKKTAVAWYMFPCSSGFVLVVFSWERGSINRNLCLYFFSFV